MAGDDSGETVEAPNATYKIAAPETFNFDAPEGWPKWKTRYKRFCVATKLNKAPPEEQINMLIYTMGDKAEEVLLTFGLSGSDAKNYEVIITKFDNYFAPKINVIYERARFNTRCQHPGESANEYITALHTIAAKCSFQDLKNEFIRDRIVVGIADKKLSEKMQLDENLDLNKATKMVTQAEEIKKQSDAMNQGHIDKIFSQKTKVTAKKKPQNKSNLKKETIDPAVNNLKKCCWCQGATHERRVCPARNSVCHTCHNKGHFAKACLSKRIDAVYEECNDELCLGAINTPNPQEDYWNASVTINGESIRFKIDTGSDVTALPASYATGKLRICNKILTAADNNPLNVVGVAAATLHYNNNSIKQDIYYIENLREPVLGKVDAVKLGLVKRMFLLNRDEPNIDINYVLQ